MGIYLLILLLVLSLGACSGKEPPLPEGLEGTWHSEWEELRIMDRQVEITGYYELEGQRLAGVATRGTLSVREDGTLELQMDSTVLPLRLIDENTLQVGQITYYR